MPAPTKRNPSTDNARLSAVRALECDLAALVERNGVNLAQAELDALTDLLVMTMRHRRFQDKRASGIAKVPCFVSKELAPLRDSDNEYMAQHKGFVTAAMAAAQVYAHVLRVTKFAVVPVPEVAATVVVVVSGHKRSGAFDVTAWCSTLWTAHRLDHVEPTSLAAHVPMAAHAEISQVIREMRAQHKANQPRRKRRKRKPKA